MSTLLYNKDGDQIYPITDGQSVLVENYTNLNTALAAITKQLQNIATNDGQSTVSFKFQYTASTANNSTNLLLSKPVWGSSPSVPTKEKPYIWKEITVIINSVPQDPIYELIASYTETSQIWYATVSDATTVTLKKPTKKDNNGQDVEDEDKFQDNNFKPEEQYWQESPKSISAGEPNLWMAQRTKDSTGKWSDFTLALLGKWVNTSIVDFKYCVTQTKEAPTLDRGLDNPGDVWENSISSDKIGYLWMITATSVGGVYNKIDEVIWSNPTYLGNLNNAKEIKTFYAKIGVNGPKHSLVTVTQNTLPEYWSEFGTTWATGINDDGTYIIEYEEYPDTYTVYICQGIFINGQVVADSNGCYWTTPHKIGQYTVS